MPKSLKATVPIRVLEDHKVRFGAMWVLAREAVHAGGGAGCFVGKKLLSKEVGIRESQVCEYRAELNRERFTKPRRRHRKSSGVIF